MCCYFKDKRPASYLAEKPLPSTAAVVERAGLMDAEVPERTVNREENSTSVREASDRGDSIMKYFKQKPPATDSLCSVPLVSCSSSNHAPTRTFMSLVAEEYDLKEEDQGTDELEERITRIDIEKINVGQYVKDKMQATRAFVAERSIVKPVRMHKSEKENSNKKIDPLTRTKPPVKQSDIATLIKSKVASKTVDPSSRLREPRETALVREPPKPLTSEAPLKKRIATKSQGNHPATQPSSTGILKNLLNPATGKKSDSRSRALGVADQPEQALSRPQAPRASSSQHGQQTMVTVDSILGRSIRQSDQQPSASLKPARASGNQKKISQTEISNYMKKSD